MPQSVVLWGERSFRGTTQIPEKFFRLNFGNYAAVIVFAYCVFRQSRSRANFTRLLLKGFQPIGPYSLQEGGLATLPVHRVYFV